MNISLSSCALILGSLFCDAAWKLKMVRGVNEATFWRSRPTNRRLVAMWVCIKLLLICGLSGGVKESGGSVKAGGKRSESSGKYPFTLISYNNNNNHDDVYSAVIMAEPLREFTQWIQKRRQEDQDNRLEPQARPYRQPVNRIHHRHLLLLLSPLADTHFSRSCRALKSIKWWLTTYRRIYIIVIQTTQFNFSFSLAQ